MTTEPLTRLVRNLRRTLDATDVASLPDADLLARFRESRDPAAFETIVLRHGPRVLSACRQVLGHEADVEDAFQATFVVLMRDAKSVRSGRSLPHWLFGVAHRIAMQARASRKRRERLEAGADAKRAPAPDLSWQEACVILHEELDRLQETTRRPLMLCYLEGLTRDEAAAQLGRTAGSVKKSLERGRELLRKRLTRRGVTLSAGLLAAVADSAKAGMSTGLVRATIECAANPSAGAVTLARGIPAGRLAGLRVLGACLAASIAIVGVALGVPGQQKPDTLADKLGALKAEAAPAKKADDKKLPDALTYAGTVIGPDGKPVKGAKLTLLLDGNTPLRAVGESGPDGTFKFDIKQKDLTPECYYENGRELWSVGAVLAQAPGMAVGWGHGSVSPGYDMKLQIPVDDVPIEGRVKNLEGLPVAGATVRVIGLFVPKHGDLDDFYHDVKAGKLNQQLLYDHLITFQGDELKEGRLDPLYPPVKTAKDGSFTFKGIGRERMALMRIEGEGIETEDVLVMGRVAETVLATPPKEPDQTGFRGFPILDGRHTVYGCKFEHTAAPSRPIVGVVSDLDTGKPVAGAVITVESVNRGVVSRPDHIRVTADKEGRYRLAGAPVKRSVRLRVDGPPDQPYLATSVEVPQPAGVGPVEVDAKLKRGIWATVRVTDKADKSAVTAEVHYFVLTENPNLKDLPVLRGTPRQRVRIENAEYRVPVLPGPGIVAIRIPWDHNFALRGGKRSEAIPAVPYAFRKMEFLGHAKIDPPADSKGVTCEIGLNSSDD